MQASETRPGNMLKVFMLNTYSLVTQNKALHCLKQVT